MLVQSRSVEVNGRHYQLTSEAWLQNMDRHASRVRELLRQTYPPGTGQMEYGVKSTVES